MQGSPSQKPDAGGGDHEKETELPDTVAEKFWGGDDAKDLEASNKAMKNKKGINKYFMINSIR